MKQKTYQKPSMRVVLLQQRHHLLDASEHDKAPQSWGSQDSENPYDFD